MVLTSNLILTIHMEYFLFVLNSLVCIIALVGLFIHSSEYIYFFICNELFIFSIILNLLLVGSIYDDLIPQVFVFFILATSSAEIVIGLSIIVKLYRIPSLCLSYDESSATNSVQGF
jgi:NADH:ubiquinone oxidoreductase subunit K